MLRGVGDALTHASLSLVARRARAPRRGPARHRRALARGDRRGLGSRLTLLSHHAHQPRGHLRAQRDADHRPGRRRQPDRAAARARRAAGAGDGVVRLRPARRAAAARAGRLALDTGGRASGEPIDDGRRGRRSRGRDRGSGRAYGIASVCAGTSRRCGPAPSICDSTPDRSAWRSPTPRSRRSRRSRGKSWSPRRSDSR